MTHKGKEYKEATEIKVGMYWVKQGQKMIPYKIEPQLTVEYLTGKLGKIPNWRKEKYKGETVAEFQERLRQTKKIMKGKTLWVEV